jgi:hypothetical protein
VLCGPSWTGKTFLLETTGPAYLSAQHGQLRAAGIPAPAAPQLRPAGLPSDPSSVLWRVRGIFVTNGRTMATRAMIPNVV